MSMIAPALLCATPEEYKARVEQLHGFAERVHIDISDGEFAPSHTIAPKELWWPQGWVSDIHAMVNKPSIYAQVLVSLKPHMIIFHAESDENLIPIMQYVKKYGCKAGVALLRPTVPSIVAEYIKNADHVMIFSGNLGYHGGTASMMQVEKVRLIKKINEDAEIGWDGGVTLDNAYAIASGGVDVLNVGGTIASSTDPQATYATLESEANKSGVF